MGMPLSDEHLLTISEFSRLSAISIRMLRHYDEHDVLHPTAVDPSSGYRFYSAALLRPALRLRALRDVGLGVAELAACAPLLDDPVALRAVLERQRARLQDDASAVASRIRGVDHLIEALEEPAMSIDVRHTTLPARTVASLRDTIPTYADEGLLWARLMAALPAVGAAPTPEPRVVAVFHDDGWLESNPDVEVQLDVTGPFTGTDDARCVQVPASEIATATLHGSYDEIGTVMEALGQWAAANRYRFAGPMFNIYVVGPGQDPDPAHWVTEVCVPVTA